MVKKKFFREIDLFDSTIFFGPDFLFFLARAVNWKAGKTNLILRHPLIPNPERGLLSQQVRNRYWIHFGVQLHTFSKVTDILRVVNRVVRVFENDLQ